MTELKIDFRDLFEQANDSIFIEDLEGNILAVNSRACEMFGYSKDEFTKLNAFCLVPPSISEGMFPDIVSMLKEKGQFRVNTKNIKKNGDIIDVEVSGKLISSGSQSVVLVIVRDISNILKIQRQLNEQRENYRVLAELCQTGVFVHDGVNILFANDYLYRMLHIPRDKPIDMDELLSFADGESRRKILKFMAERFAGEEAPFSYEISGYSSDGRRLYGRLFVQMIQYDGKPAIMANLTDITEYRSIKTEMGIMVKMLRLMNELNKLMTGKAAISSVIDSVSRILLEECDYELVWFYIDGKVESVKVRFSCHCEEMQEKLGEIMAMEHTPYTLAINSCSPQSVLIDPFAENLRDILPFTARKEEFIWWISVPLSYRGNILGTLNILSARDIKDNKAEEETLVRVAETVAYLLCKDKH